MNTLIILISKILRFILNKLHRGTSLPGKIAYQLNNNILSHLELPKITIFVTGTSGKTTTMEILTDIYKKCGYKVYSNNTGSNLIYGVTTTVIDSCKLNGKTKADVVILEIDERYIKVVAKYITPNYFIITNLGRDQSGRNGHYDFVFSEIEKGIKEETHLILNGDDPLVTRFSLGKKNKITYYGIEKNKHSKLKPDYDLLDMLYCPICHKKMIFDYFNYENLGYYHCPNNDYVRPKTIYDAKLTKDGFEVEGINIKTDPDILYFVYNMVSCYTLCRESGIEKDKLEYALNNIDIPLKRENMFKVKDNVGTILLSKNETPLSFNRSFEYIKNHEGKKTVAIGFNKVSWRYPLKDLSWLYDFNYELLKDESIEKIILLGPFGYDIAVALKQFGIDESKFDFCLDSKVSLDYLLDNSIGDLYVAVYFDLAYPYFKELKKRGLLL